MNTFPTVVIFLKLLLVNKIAFLLVHHFVSGRIISTVSQLLVTHPRFIVSYWQDKGKCRHYIAGKVETNIGLGLTKKRERETEKHFRERKRF